MIRGGRNMEVIFLFYIFYFCPTLLKLAGTTNASNNKIKKNERKKKTSNVLQPKEAGLSEIDSSSSKQVRISTNGLTITLLKAR
jgi:hypothetical protein